MPVAWNRDATRRLDQSLPGRSGPVSRAARDHRARLGAVHRWALGPSGSAKPSCGTRAWSGRRTRRAGSRAPSSGHVRVALIGPGATRHGRADAGGVATHQAYISRGGWPPRASRRRCWLPTRRRARRRGRPKPTRAHSACIACSDLCDRIGRPSKPGRVPTASIRYSLESRARAARLATRAAAQPARLSPLSRRGAPARDPRPASTRALHVHAHGAAHRGPADAARGDRSQPVRRARRGQRSTR